MSFLVDKQKLKQTLLIAAIVLSVIIISITYFFFLYRNQSINETISNIFNILTPFIIGVVIAYIMKSTCNFYEKWILKGFIKSKKYDVKKAEKTANGLSVLFAYITWFLAIGLLLGIAIPQIAQSITKFVNDMIVNIPIYVDKLVVWEENFLKDHDMLRPIFDKVLNGVIEWATTDLMGILQAFVSQSLIPIVLGIIGSVIDIAIGLVISVFILLGRKKLARKSVVLLHCVFKKEKTIKAIVDEFKFADKMFSGFLEGKIIDSTIIGFVYYLVLEILNVPYAPLVAVICGVTNIIPIFGPFIGAIPSGFIILTADPFKVIPFVIFVFVIQFIDGYIIDPHIVGGNIKISSFCVVFAVLLFGGLWGFAGLLIGVPTFAVIYDICKKVVISILKKRGKYDVFVEYEKNHRSKKKPAKTATAVVAEGENNPTEKKDEG